MSEIDVAIIGAGVVGLSAALKLSSAGASVCILERETRPGRGMSTHNSGVIHAGIYHPPGSLKATLCVEGRPQLYAFCETHGIPHQRSGKLIVATREEDLATLEALCTQGLTNGVASLAMVDADFVRQREPYVRAVGALWSPDTGVLDSEALVSTLHQQCVGREVAVLPATPLVGASPAGRGVELATARETFVAGCVVNAAGLYADRVSDLLGATPVTIFPCRGEYAELAPSKRSWVNGLVYPLPHADGSGLGVHLTRTVRGSVLIGPTAAYRESKDDYEADRLPLDAFLEPTRALLPGIGRADLQPGGTGIRAKLHGPDSSFADFLIERDARNPCVIQAVGTESPALTACLAIGDRIVSLWRGR